MTIRHVPVVMGVVAAFATTLFVSSACNTGQDLVGGAPTPDAAPTTPASGVCVAAPFDAGPDATVPDGGAADSGKPDADACTPDSDPAFCTKAGRACGAASGTDNCGAARIVSSCGTCTASQTCNASGVCVTSGPITYGTPGQSCAGGLTCAGGVDCCQNIVVPGGTYPMGRGTTGTDAYSGAYSNEVPEHNATVDSFALDTFEVTVGRFRKFANAYNGTAPPAGAAAHPKITGSGWDSAWNSSLPASQAALLTNVKCNSTYQTWTDAAGANESKAINCVSWFEAFAFCAWDGGRLPTEAEWEYAAAGGSDNRLYPWGSTAPDCTLANFSGCGDAVAAVGSYSAGNGKWGHRDLAGNVWEWNLDWYASYTASASTNYANISSGSGRVVRGGFFYGGAAYLRAAYRGDGSPSTHGTYVGFRCARTP